MVVIAHVAEARLGPLLCGFLPGACLTAAALAVAAVVAHGSGLPLGAWEPVLAASVSLAAGGLILVAQRRRLLAPALADLIDGIVRSVRRRASTAAAE
jgi:hypothetical protein